MTHEARAPDASQPHNGSPAPASILQRIHMPAEVTSTIVSRALPRSPIGITRASNHQRNSGLTSPYEREPAYLVVLQLIPFGEQDLWVGGRPATHIPFGAGCIAIYDLERNWVANLIGAYDCMQFYISNEALASTAKDIGVGPIDHLSCPPHAPVYDPVAHSISLALQPALANPERASTLFIDHITLALCAHLVNTFATPRQSLPARSRIVRGLARWQEMRAKELIRDNLDGAIPLQALADACNLSRSHFAKSFRISTGVTPHYWMIVQRVELAKTYLEKGNIKISEVAQLCGFADQSHLTRTFSRIVGTTPSTWRKLHNSTK